MPIHNVPAAKKKRANSHFADTAGRDALWQQERQKAKAAEATKTAKLRALRLARDAAEKATADRLQAEAESGRPTGEVKKVPDKPRTPTRIRY